MQTRFILHLRGVKESHLGVKTGEYLLSINWCWEGAVKIAFHKDIKEWNFIILFKLNCEFNVVVSPIQVMQKTLSITFVFEKSKSIVYISEPIVGWLMFFITHFSSKSHMKCSPKQDQVEKPLRRHKSGHSIDHQKQNDSSLLQTRVNSLGPIGVI